MVRALREWNTTQSQNVCKETLKVANTLPLQNPQDINSKLCLQSEVCDAGPVVEGHQEVCQGAWGGEVC